MLFVPLFRGRGCGNVVELVGALVGFTVPSSLVGNGVGAAEGEKVGEVAFLFGLNNRLLTVLLSIELFFARGTKNLVTKY